MIGTLVNVATVICGSMLGLFLHARLPLRLTTIAFQAIGLFTLYLGFSMAMRTENLLILIGSTVSGAIIGELLDIEKQINRLGNFLKRRLKSSNAKFTDGLVTAFLLFCMGSMTVLGAFEEGLGGRPHLLLAKALLDGFSAMALAAGLGAGVVFAAIPLLLYQGALTLFAGALGSVLTTPVVTEMSAVGGLLLIGLGIDILEIKVIRVSNFLPGLVVAVGLALIFL